MSSVTSFNCFLMSRFILINVVILILTDGSAGQQNVVPLDKDMIVDQLNRFRVAVTPPPTDMQKLEWDDKLANLANRHYVDYGETAHCHPEFHPISFASFVEHFNITSANGVSQFTITQPTDSFRTAITTAEGFKQIVNDTFGLSGKNYLYHQNACTGDCRPYMDLVMAKANKIGCAAVFQCSENEARMWCSTNAEYMVGAVPYDIGPNPVSYDHWWPTGEDTSKYCGDHGQGTCICDYGYSGEFCAYPVDHCDLPIFPQRSHDNETNPLFKDMCQPHGECVSTPSGGPECICDPRSGFTGIFCKDAKRVLFECLTFEPLWNTTKAKAAAADESLHVGCDWLNKEEEEWFCLPHSLSCLKSNWSPFCEVPLGWCIPKNEIEHDFLTTLPPVSPIPVTTAPPSLGRK